VFDNLGGAGHHDLSKLGSAAWRFPGGEVTNPILACVAPAGTTGPAREQTQRRSLIIARASIRRIRSRETP
jgi:hypothetical protein